MKHSCLRAHAECLCPHPKRRTSWPPIATALSFLVLLSLSDALALPIASGVVNLEGSLAWRSAGTGCGVVATTTPTVVARSITTAGAASNTGFDIVDVGDITAPDWTVHTESNVTTSMFASSGSVDAYVTIPPVLEPRCEDWILSAFPGLAASVSNISGTTGSARSTQQLTIILDKNNPANNADIFATGIHITLSDITLSGDRARSSFMFELSDNSHPVFELELVTPTIPGEQLVVRDFLTSDIAGSLQQWTYDATSKTYRVGGDYFWYLPFASPLRDTVVFRVTANVALPEPPGLALLVTVLGAATIAGRRRTSRT